MKPRHHFQNIIDYWGVHSYALNAWCHSFNVVHMDSVSITVRVT